MFKEDISQSPCQDLIEMLCVIFESKSNFPAPASRTAGHAATMRERSRRWPGWRPGVGDASGDEALKAYTAGQRHERGLARMDSGRPDDRAVCGI